MSSIIFWNCSNSSEPDNSNKPRLTLTADKTTGSAPLSVKFFGRMEGNTEGITGHIPDYIFFPQIGKTIIRYKIPDTSMALNPDWNAEYSYPSGKYKVFLLYQGIKDGEIYDMISDTLVINVQ